jgi:hypothetical protein
MALGEEGKVLRIPWTMKMKKADILKDLNIREN